MTVLLMANRYDIMKREDTSYMKKTRFILAILLLAASLVSVVVPAEPVSALTDAEKAQCKKDWAGTIKKKQLEVFKKTDCAGSGYCTATYNKADDNYAIVCEEKEVLAKKKFIEIVCGATESNKQDCEKNIEKDGSTKIFINGKSYDINYSGWRNSNEAALNAYIERLKNAGDDGAAGDAPSCSGLVNIIPCDEKGGNPIMSLVLMVVNFLSVGVGLAVVGGIIWGGIIYSQANGSSQKAQEGVTIITNAVIALIVFILMYSILQFIIPGGVLNT